MFADLGPAPTPELLVGLQPLLGARTVVLGNCPLAKQQIVKPHGILLSTGLVAKAIPRAWWAYSVTPIFGCCGLGWFPKWDRAEEATDLIEDCLCGSQYVIAMSK